MQACKSLNSIAEEHLYRHITWKWHHSSSGITAPIHQLLINLLHRPSLALYVHSLCLEEFGYRLQPGYKSSTRITDAELDLARQLIKESRLPNCDVWVERLVALDVETIVALILLQLHNLESLTVDILHRHGDSGGSTTPHFRPLGDVLRCALSPSRSTRVTRFERLTAIFWPSVDFESDMGLMSSGEHINVLPILCAPSLQIASLKLSQPASRSNINTIIQWLPQIPLDNNLRELSLRYNTVEESLLGKILVQMSRLEVFRLEVYRGIDTATFDGPVVLKALTPCRDTLKDLTIEWHLFDGFTETDVGLSIFRPLGSLRDFAALERIGGTIDVLLGDDLHLHEVLPRCLKHLKLCQKIADFGDFGDPWSQDIGPKVEALASIYQAHLPHLSCIEVRLYEPPGSGDQISENLREKYRQGLAFEVVYEEL